MKSSCILLAAGKGTRMKSDKPKVLHSLAGQPMISHVLQSLDRAGVNQTHLVVGEEFPTDFALAPHQRSCIQKDRKGTGHATKVGLGQISQDTQRVLVLYGDIPLISPKTIRAMLDNPADLVVGAFVPSDPMAYGRVETDAKGQPTRIVEFKDASDEQKTIGLCNGGPMCLDAAFLRDAIKLLSNDNAAGEYYLTDLVDISHRQGRRTESVIIDEVEISGVNSRNELARAESFFQARKAQSLMDKGVTLINPVSVTFSHDTDLAADVKVEPNVVFGPGVKVERGASIRAFSHLESCHIEQEAVIGPFARIRPGSKIGPSAKVGNFVETKNTTLGKGAKINHLSYVGDATVEAQANIGAGTITCNYDGFAKHKTFIGEGAFIGSNTALVAPIEVQAGAIVGAGSTLTKNVEAEDLAIARARQNNLSGQAAKFRERAKANK